MASICLLLFLDLLDLRHDLASQDSRAPQYWLLHVLILLLDSQNLLVAIGISSKSHLLDLL